MEEKKSTSKLCNSKIKKSIQKTGTETCFIKLKIMPVLAASICTKAGKAVVSRQFVEMAQSRIEGLLAAFPKLIGQGQQQHTFIETDAVRFIYQPLDELYLVLITNKQSNILQDIGTIQLFSRTISEYCKSLKIHEILKNSFELVIAFDEIISLGYRENITVSQIRTNCEMESHEEKLQEMLQKSKEREALEQAKLKAKQLEIQKREQRKQEKAMGGFGAGSFASRTSSFPSASSFATETTSASNAPLWQPTSQNTPNATPSAAPKRGMQLSSKPKASDVFEAIKQDEGLPSVSYTQTAASPPTALGPSVTSPMSDVLMAGVSIMIEEKISVSMNRDGGLENLEVKGELVLRVGDQQQQQNPLKVFLKVKEDANLQFKAHPLLDKQAWQTQHVIQTRDQNKPFPQNQPVPVLKWRYTSKDESMIPLSINFWPVFNDADGSIDCSVEYELWAEELALMDTVVSIPTPNLQQAPKCQCAEDTSVQFHLPTKTLNWVLPAFLDSSNSSGTLDFSLPGGASVDSLFPVMIKWKTSGKTFQNQIGLMKAVVSGPNGEEEVQCHSEVHLSTEDYRIV